MTDGIAVEERTTGYPWWGILLQGIFVTFAGLLLLGVGDITKAQGTLAVIQILGWYWFFVGIINIVLIFVDSTQWGWKLFLGVIGILAGVSIIQHPLWATVAVPYVFVILLGIEGMIIGVVDLVRAFQGGGWGTGLLGVLSIFLGGWLLAERFVATLAFPRVAGIFAVVFGIAAIVMSFSVRKSHSVGVPPRVAAA